MLGAIAAIDAGLWLAIRPCFGTWVPRGRCTASWRRARWHTCAPVERDGWILVGLLLVKLAYEHWVGALPLSGSAVVVDAHLFGVLGRRCGGRRH